MLTISKKEKRRNRKGRAGWGEAGGGGRVESKNGETKKGRKEAVEGGGKEWRNSGQWEKWDATFGRIKPVRNALYHSEAAQARMCAMEREGDTFASLYMLQRGIRDKE